MTMIVPGPQPGQPRLPGLPPYRYDPQQLHRRLIDRFHGALGRPDIDAPRKASYAKMLAQLVGDHAKAQAGTGQTQGQMGAGTETSNPTGLPEGQMIQPTTTWAGNPLPGPSPAFEVGAPDMSGLGSLAPPRPFMPGARILSRLRGY